MTSVRVGRDRTRRPRGKSRIRAAIEEQTGAMLEEAFKDRSEADRVLVGHTRKMDEITRNIGREQADLAKEKALTEKLLQSETRGLELLKKRKERMATAAPPQPTEVVEGQIVESEQKLLRLSEQQSKLTQRELRLDEDKKREEAEAIEDTRRKLKEV